MRDKTIAEIGYLVDMRLSSTENNIHSYLQYINEDVKTLKVSHKDNGLFLAANFT